MRDDDFDSYEDEPIDDDWDDDEPETLPCPHCRAQIYEDAQQCPYCGQYVTHSTSVWSGRPWWWMALGAIGIIALICALLAL